MKKNLQIVTYGIGVWALPFAVGMLLFSLQENFHELFDAAMAFTLVLATILFSTMYLSKRGTSSINQMILIGIVWMAICLLIDVPLFLIALGWTAKAYAIDVGVGYLMIPLVTAGMARAFAVGTGT
jgi:hypothetical protein